MCLCSMMDGCVHVSVGGGRGVRACVCKGNKEQYKRKNKYIPIHSYSLIWLSSPAFVSLFLRLLRLLLRLLLFFAGSFFLFSFFFFQTLPPRPVHINQNSLLTPLSSPLHRPTCHPMSGAKRLFVHGLTGGIATGKSHACGVLQSLGATILHADLLAHQCYAPQTPENEKLRQTFGTSIFTADGEVDRAKLGKLVFSEDQQLLKLNKVMFPAIERRTKEEIARLENEGRSWVVVEAAVLFEAGWERWMDEVWTMVVDPAVARLRLMKRNGLTAMEAEGRIRAQMSNEERVQRARVVIDSKGSKEETAGKLRVAVNDLKKRVKKKIALDSMSC